MSDLVDSTGKPLRKKRWPKVTVQNIDSVILRVSIVIGIILGLGSISEYLWSVIPSFPERAKTQPQLFEISAEKFNVVVVPFESLRYDSVPVHQSLMRRLRTIERKADHVLGLALLEKHIPDLDSTKAAGLADSLDADMIIWGYYDPAAADGTSITLKFLNKGDSSGTRVAEIESQSIVDMNDLVHGKITGDLEDIIHWGIALIYRGLRQNAQSIFHLRQIKSERTMFYVNVFYELARRYHDLKEYDSSIVILNTCISINEKNVRYRLSSSDSYLHMGMWAQAIAAASFVVDSLDECNYLAYFQRAHCYSKAMKYEQAIADYGQCIALKPLDWAAYYLRATRSILTQGYSEAIEDLTVAIRLNPSEASLYAVRAQVFATLNDICPALDDFIAAHHLQPSSSDLSIEKVTKAMFVCGMKEYSSGGLTLSPSVDFGYRQGAIWPKEQRVELTSNRVLGVEIGASIDPIAFVPVNWTDPDMNLAVGLRRDFQGNPVDCFLYGERMEFARIGRWDNDHDLIERTKLLSGVRENSLRMDSVIMALDSGDYILATDRFCRLYHIWVLRAVIDDDSKHLGPDSLGIGNETYARVQMFCYPAYTDMNTH